MTGLTQVECDAIDQNPLGGSLSGVCEELRKAEWKSTRGPERPRLFATAITKLFAILSASDVSPLLASRAGRDALASDLVAVRLRVLKGDFEYRHCCSLSQLVINEAPDMDIWAAVVALVRLTVYSTPPSLVSSLDMPSAYSSASQQGAEQTRRRIERRVFEETCNCTYRAVDGFYHKYFTGHRWNRRASQIWQNVKGQYSDVDRRWKQLPDGASEEEVCGWILKLQQELLPTERAAYSRSSLRDKVGVKPARQLDLFVKMRKHEKAEAKHDWRHIVVVGELMHSDQRNKAPWLQLGSAVRNVFAYQPTRLFVHAFTLTGTELEPWVFDRSGPYSGASFDIHMEPEKLIQVICAYLMMSDEELGLDILTKPKGNSLFITLPAEAHGKKKKKQQLELDPNPIAHQRAIVCRGTSCFLAKATGAAEFDRVVKYSWTSSTRRPEAELLNKANERGVKGLAKVVGYYEEVTSIQRLREGLVFSTSHKFRGVPPSPFSSLSESQLPPLSSLSQYQGLIMGSNGRSKRKSTDWSGHSSKKSRSNSQLAETEHAENGITYPIQQPQGTSLVQLDQTPYDNRILRILAVSPPGRSVSQFRSISELLQGLRDAITAHRSLYIVGKILHRDISENNIVITDAGQADGFKGMLIDLDLAKEDGKGPSGARHRTGTLEFMAIEVLLGVAHTYRHDLEAFFYVLLWLCARRGWELPGASGWRPGKSMLTRWYTGGCKEIAQSKRGDMDRNGLEVVLAEFPEAFNGVKPLCRAIRDILFPYKNGLFTGTPQDPSVLYDPILEAFHSSIAGAGPGEAET